MTNPEQLREQIEANKRAKVNRVPEVRRVGLSPGVGAGYPNDQRQTEDDSAWERLFELWRNRTTGEDKMKFSIRSLWGKSAGSDVETQQTWVIAPAGENVHISGESITRAGERQSSGTIEFSARGAFDLAQALNVVAGHVEELSAPVPTPDPRDLEIAKLNEYAANLQDDYAALQKQLDKAHESEKRLNAGIAVRDAQIKGYQGFLATARQW